MYTEADCEAETLEVYLRDPVMDTRMILSYTIWKELPVIIRNVKFVHEGAESIVLNRAMSLSVDLPDDDYEMMTLTGAWARERYVKVAPLHQAEEREAGRLSVETVRTGGRVGEGIYRLGSGTRLADLHAGVCPQPVQPVD